MLGDLNIIPQQLEESGWLKQLDARYKISNLPTSTKASKDRHIDMAIFSIAIQSLILSLQADIQVPWGPHYGLILTIAANPRSIQGTVLVTPATLPFKEYHKKRTDLNQLEQWHIIKKAPKQASGILKKQKQKTGIAILGSPLKELTDNPIFQGSLKQDSIFVGEDLAQKALTAEKIILLTAGIPTNKHFKYTGRAQFPQFKIKSLIKSTEEFEHLTCQHYPFWGVYFKICTSG